MKELRKLNFNKLITVSVRDVTTYSYHEYKNNGYEHKPISGYCISCEKKGLNNAEGEFKGISSFKNETVENCYTNFLKEEISILKPKIIFAVGSAVEWWVKHFVKNTCFVQQLPHPAGRRRGFRDDHYKSIYFWGVTVALHLWGTRGR